LAARRSLATPDTRLGFVDITDNAYGRLVVILAGIGQIQPAGGPPDELGAEMGTGKQLLGKAFGMARDLADAAREHDFLRLVGDIVTSRQSEDTFKTFRDAGRQLGLQRLGQIGEQGERDHDEYAKEANRLCTQLFVELVRQGDTSGLDMTTGTASSDERTA